MSWLERDIMSLKEQFISKIKSAEFSVSELCRQFNISRKTAYKWIDRHNSDPIFGLTEQSRRPLSSPNRIKEEVLELILKTRDKFPAWGGRKLRQYLINEKYPDIPCEATFNRTLKHFERILPAESLKRQTYIRFEKEEPNELWQMDFKGHYAVVDGRCHPLTVLDDHSRYCVILKACSGETGILVQEALEDAFRKYGLPLGMTMDNGPPWKGSPPFRLSKLTVWLMRLGIKVGHSSPRHPQTQGKDERFHRSLKAEVLCYRQLSTITDSQIAFDDWRRTYNHIRPHEGIGMKCPVERYRPSPRPYPEKLPAIEYEEGDEIRKVRMSGTFTLNSIDFFVGEHLTGEYVGLRMTSPGVFDVYYCNTKIQQINLNRRNI